MIAKIISTLRDLTVERILAQNITYQQKNSYDLCRNEYATKNKIPKRDAYLSNFDYPGNCSHLCSLECNTVTFEIDEN